MPGTLYKKGFRFGILFSGLFRVLNSIFGSLIGSFLDVSVSIFNSIHPFNILYVKLLLTFNLFITIFNLNYYSSCEGRKQPSFQSLLNLLISHNRSKRGFFLNRHIPINSCSFSVDWSINWCKWCRSFYPRSRNATYSLDTLLYSLLKYESRPSNSDCLSSFVTSV